MAYGEDAGLPVEVCVSALSRLTNGVMVSVTSADVPAEGQSWVIYGDRGRITSDGKAVELTNEEGSKELAGVGLAPIEARFVEAVLDGALNPSPARDGAYCVAFLEAMYASIRTGSPAKANVPSWAM